MISVRGARQADLDLGNYERFLDLTLTRDHNLTTGKVWLRRAAAPDGESSTVVTRVCFPSHVRRCTAAFSRRSGVATTSARPCRSSRM